jgi:hypothetical protein
MVAESGLLHVVLGRSMVAESLFSVVLGRSMVAESLLHVVWKTCACRKLITCGFRKKCGC